MNFTTKIPISKCQFPIDYNSKIVTIGSCFAENMAVKFDYYKFENNVNPFGIIFNPVAIENVIFRALNDKKFTENDIFFLNERWQCFEVHSVLSNQNKEVYLKNLNEILIDLRNQISVATHFIITYGTSWIYKLKTTNQVVANCHKVAQNQFDKEILSIEIIQNSIENTVQIIQKFNPNCNFIFTVSPVRHIKDGFVENTLSKSHLIAAIHKTEKLKLENCNYFPAFEIMMDELRDYRFYAEDMLHPSQIAVEYIWEKFVQSQISETVFQTMQKIENIQKSLNHKPFHSKSNDYQAFVDNLNAKIRALNDQFPNITFD